MAFHCVVGSNISPTGDVRAIIGVKTFSDTNEVSEGVRVPSIDTLRISGYTDLTYFRIPQRHANFKIVYDDGGEDVRSYHRVGTSTDWIHQNAAGNPIICVKFE